MQRPGSFWYATRSNYCNRKGFPTTSVYGCSQQNLIDVLKAIKSPYLCRRLSLIPNGLGHSITFPENTSASGSCTGVVGIDSCIDLRRGTKNQSIDQSINRSRLLPFAIFQ